MVRVLLTMVIVAAAALVALWQFDVVALPFGLSEAGAVSAAQSNLFEAVKGSDLVTLRERLEAGAEVDARDEYGQTPLMYAVSANADPEVITTLLAAGADVNAQTDAGWTPLMYAARDADTPALPLLLLNAGADPTVRSGDGQTARDLARQNSAVRNSGLYPRLDEMTDKPFVRGWPSAYVVPVEGATLSSRRSHLPGAPRAYRNGTHEGFDFYDGTVSVEIAYGTPIQAVASGTVVRADHDYRELTEAEYREVIQEATNSLSTPPEVLDQLRGRQVWIRHPGGFISRYAHLADIPDEVVAGGRVVQGQEIGFTGNSGTLEAALNTEDDPHPHVEIWRDDTYLGSNLEAEQIYGLAAQLFGERALPPYTE